MDVSVVGIAWGFGAFLLAWAGKHLLDRTALPKLLDFWASFSRKLTVRRAGNIVKEYVHRHERAADLRLLFVDLLTHAVYVIISVASLVAAAVILVVESFARRGPPPVRFGGPDSGVALMAILPAFLYMVLFALLVSSIKSILRRPAEYRNDTIKRLRKVASKHMTPAEIEELVARLPPAPVREP